MGFLTRYDGEFREPLVGRQRSLTPCVWPGRSRHCSRVMGGTRASRRVEEGLSRSFSDGGGKPSFPSTSAGDYRELPRVPLRGEGYCEVGGALGTPLGLDQWKRASSRMESGTSGFLSDSDSDCTVRSVLGQESHATSCLRNGILVASRVVPGVSGPLSSCV